MRELGPLQSRFLRPRQGASDPLIAAVAAGRHPLPAARRGSLSAPGLRPVGYREPRADHEGRSPRGGAGPYSPLPRSPLTPGWSLGSPRDSPEPPLPPWTCPGTPARLAGSICAASPWLEHYGEPGARNGRGCSPLGPLRPWKKPLGGSWPWSWKMSWLPTWSPWYPKRKSPPHGTTATIRILSTASHLPHRLGLLTHYTYAESP